MSRYKLRVTDAPGQPFRLYDVGDDLAVAACEQMARDGFVGGSVEVIDTTIDHPDRNVVHRAERKARQR